MVSYLICTAWQQSRPRVFPCKEMASTSQIFRDYGGSASATRPNHGGFLVIGAGLPRTGTMSLRTALGELLDGDCYHGMDFGGGTEEDWDFWIAALDGRHKKEDYQKYLVTKKGCRSGCDFPISYFYRELMQAFPEAKVLLTVRDPERWYESVVNTIYSQRAMGEDFAVRTMSRMKGDLKMIDFHTRLRMTPPKGMKGIDKGFFEVIEAGKDASVKFFNAWTEEVKRVVPKDRLLIHEAKEGWKPICDFLNLPMPEGDYPRVNDTKQINAMLNKMYRDAYMVVYGGGPVLLGILIFLILSWQ